MDTHIRDDGPTAQVASGGTNRHFPTMSRSGMREGVQPAGRRIRDSNRVSTMSSLVRVCYHEFTKTGRLIGRRILPRS